ncbi:hypothetical protein V8C37DRAFT_414574 [Trichoderma ceciliae]
MGGLQLSGVHEYVKRYGRNCKYTGFLATDETPNLYRDYDGISMMAMSAIKGPTTHAQFLPSKELAEWHVMRSGARDHAVNRPRSRTDSSPKLAGAFYNDLKTRTRVSAWWVHDFEKRRLYIGKMSVKRRQGLDVATRMVLLSAIQEASRFYLREIIAWDPVPQIVAQAERLVGDLGQGMTATLENRSEMIPCFRWHGGEAKDVVWTEGEYYSWG